MKKKKVVGWGGEELKLVFFHQHNKPKTGSNYSEAKVTLYMKNIKIKSLVLIQMIVIIILPLGTHVP